MSDDQKKKPALLIAILVVLAGVSGYLWLSGEEEVDAGFANAQFTFTCPKCEEDFQVTGEAYHRSFVEKKGLLCPSCQQPVEDVAAAAKDLGEYTPTEKQVEHSKTVGFKKKS